MRSLDAPSIDEIRGARRRIAGLALRTPLVRLGVLETPAEIWLKLECLQPIGSFKIRGAGNALRSMPREALADGVYTASAGNMAQGVAWTARELDVACTVVVPDNAPETKLRAIERLGARIVKLPFDAWWNVLVEHGLDGMPGAFVHPVSDRMVMAGNGTIALEILEDLPDVETILVPFGGGGLSCGIAAAAAATAPAVRILACEVATAAPLAASLAAGAPRAIEHTPSFVDGIGGKSLLEEIWPIASRLLGGSLVVSVADVASAVRTLVERNHVVAEGAGAASVAAALGGEAPGKKIVCVVSGGNIDAAKLGKILNGAVP